MEKIRHILEQYKEMVEDGELFKMLGIMTLLSLINITLVSTALAIMGTPLSLLISLLPIAFIGTEIFMILLFFITTTIWYWE